MKAIKPLGLLLVAAGVGFGAPSLSAQEAANIGLSYAEAQSKNQDLLKQYKWTTHTTLQKDGDTKFDFEVACHLNEAGQMEQEVESSESDVKRKRGVRGRRQRKEAGEYDELIDQILKVVESYVFMSKGQEVDFFDKAKVTDGEGDLAGTTKVAGADVSVKGDSLTKWIDPKVFQAKRITFKFEVEGHHIEGEGMYRAIDDGPNVARLATIQIVDLKGTIQTEFTDYTKEL
jgi:hypothetical protein